MKTVGGEGGHVACNYPCSLGVHFSLSSVWKLHCLGPCSECEGGGGGGGGGVTGVYLYARGVKVWVCAYIIFKCCVHAQVGPHLSCCKLLTFVSLLTLVYCRNLFSLFFSGAASYPQVNWIPRSLLYCSGLYLAHITGLLHRCVNVLCAHDYIIFMHASKVMKLFEKMRVGTYTKIRRVHA